MKNAIWFLVLTVAARAAYLALWPVSMAGWPFLRKLTLRLPRFLWPIPRAYGHVIAFTEDGKLVADLQDPSGAYPETTGITETVDRLYVQSLHARGLGWLAK